jgi:hypothetical protein
VSHLILWEEEDYKLSWDCECGEHRELDTVPGDNNAYFDLRDMADEHRGVMDAIENAPRRMSPQIAEWMDLA